MNLVREVIDTKNTMYYNRTLLIFKYYIGLILLDSVEGILDMKKTKIAILWKSCV